MFSGEKYRLKYHKQKEENRRHFDVKVNLYSWFDHFYFYTVLPSSLTMENVTSQRKLLGTEGQDLTLSCIAVGGTPAPNVVVIIDNIVCSKSDSDSTTHIQNHQQIL
jgi:hypothetical protein